MSIADKLKELKEAKEAIKDAIIQKGVEILESDTFKSYADKINAIASSSGANTYVLTPTNFNGLSLWFEATLNTRAGFNSSKKYVEPLIVTPNDVETSATYTMAYKSTTSATWDGKFLNLGNTGAFKINHCFHNNPMTIEAVFRFSEIPNDNSVFRLWHNGKNCLVVYGKGASSTPGRFWVTGGSNDLPLAEANKLYYIVVRYSSSDLTININNEVEKTFSSVSLETPTSNSYFGIGTAPGTSATFSDSTYTTGMQFGMIRCWNRSLTNAEIINNYNEVMTRFEG